MDKLQRDKLIRNQSVNIDLQGRRMINCGNSKNFADYVTRAELNAAILTSTVNPTSFSDNFTRANSTLAGANYIFSTIRNPSNSDSFSSCSVFLNQLSFAHVGSSNNSSAMVSYVPVSIIPGLFGKNQFSQATWISTNQGRCGIGAGILLLEITSGYNLTVNGATQSQLVQASPVTGTNIILTLDTPTTGDVFKIGVIFGVSSNKVYCYRNGVLMATANPYVDSDVNRPTVCGWPALVADGLNLVGGSIWTNYSCGLFTP